MPALQTTLSKLNALSLPDRINDAESELFSPGRSLSDAVRALDMEVDELAPYLDLLPVGLQEALRALIFSALTREGGRQPITFAWVPSYDYELKLWDVSETPATPGGITAILGSRYPTDAHPLAAS